MALPLLAALALGGCWTQAGAPTGAMAPAPAHPGEHLFRHRCGSCHDLFPPHAYTLAQWRVVLSRMQTGAALNNRQVLAIYRWLETKQ